MSGGEVQGSPGVECMLCDSVDMGKGKIYIAGKRYEQGQTVLSLTGKFPESWAALHCSPPGGSITSVFCGNSTKHITTALLLALQFLCQRPKVLKHYKESNLKNFSNVP